MRKSRRPVFKKSQPEFCEYCHIRPALYLFKTAAPGGKWCCEENVKRCPANREKYRQKALERHRNSRKQTLEREIAAGMHKCFVCGQPAKYLDPHKYIALCSKKMRDCPEIKTYTRKQRLKMFEEHPELKEIYRQVAYDVHNREEVKEKKRETMLRLHHGDCEECKTFQTNFKEAHKKRRGIPLRKEDR
jgi:hypothetical protein